MAYFYPESGSGFRCLEARNSGRPWWRGTQASTMRWSGAVGFLPGSSGLTRLIKHHRYVHCMHPGVGFDDRLASNLPTMTPTATFIIVRSRAQFHAPWLYRRRRPGVGNANRQSPRTAPASGTRSAATVAPFTPARLADRTRRHNRRVVRRLRHPIITAVPLAARAQGASVCPGTRRIKWRTLAL